MKVLAALAVATVAAVGTLTPDLANAQTVHGVVMDAADDSPVEGVSVFLLDPEGEVSRSILTNEDGRFVVILPFDGPFRLRAERIGYAEVESSPLTLDGNDRLEVVIRISVEPLTLEPITIVAPSGRLTPGRVKNAERRANGEGVFLSRAEILGTGLNDVRDVIRDVEGLRTTLSARRGAIPLWDGLYLYSGTGWGCMKVVINELPVADWIVRDPRELVTILPYPEHIEAVEVYRTMREVPEEHQFIVWPPDQRTPCGLVAIWTTAAW